MNGLVFFVMSLGNLAGALVVPRSGKSPARSALAIALSCVAIVSPRFLSRDQAFFRTVAAFALLAGAYRVVFIVVRPDSTAFGRALAVALPIVDPQRIRETEKTLRLDAFVVGAVNVAFAYGLFLAVSLVPPVAPYAGTPSAMRTLVGGASAYFLVDGSARFATAIFAAVGLDIGPLHDAPILARSVGEFWSRRWNRAVHRMLDAFAFRPVATVGVQIARRHWPRTSAARVGIAAGVMVAFAASAVLHFVPIWVACDLRRAVPMGAFFLIHGVLVIVEAKLRVGRWPRVLGHVWTLAMFAATAPLFVEPLLESLGG